MTETSDNPATDGEPIADEIIASVSDYLDGALPAAQRAEVEQKVASDPDWKRAHTELVETREALSGLQKAHAPTSFVEDVTSTIHKRSAGRFFGRRTLGDRVPFGVLLVIALVILIPIAYFMWASSTGSLKRDETPPSEGAGRGSQQLVPKP
jgi:anti-sigma factor RsiW